MNNTFLLILSIVLILYLLLCAGLYLNQEKLLFYPTKLPKNHRYQFKATLEEINLKVAEEVELNALLFKAQERKGVVLFLHGNGGTVYGWGQGAWLYNSAAYDVLYLDYRGYGKSEGKIYSEQQLVADVQVAYDYLKEQYAESQIVVSGTSMGTGIATQIAAQNEPTLLLLNAPYYSLQSLILEKIPIVPSFLVKYKFKTFHHLQFVQCPVMMLHGNLDRVIPYEHALRLEEKYPYMDVHILEGFGHNDLSSSSNYMRLTRKALKMNLP